MKIYLVCSEKEGRIAAIINAFRTPQAAEENAATWRMTAGNSPSAAKHHSATLDGNDERGGGEVIVGNQNWRYDVCRKTGGMLGYSQTKQGAFDMAQHFANEFNQEVTIYDNNKNAKCYWRCYPSDGGIKAFTWTFEVAEVQSAS